VSQIHRDLDKGESALAQSVKDAHSLGLSFAEIASAAGLHPDGVVELMAGTVFLDPVRRVS
jgi:hypothetical protein